jgi:hypothetical protein
VCAEIGGCVNAVLYRLIEGDVAYLWLDAMLS